jgi:hypothetical protein
MNKGTLRLVALLVVLALLTVLMVKRQHLTAEAAADEAVRPVVKLWDTVARQENAAIALLALTALFAFVTWKALRAKEGEDQPLPPAGESGAGGPTATGGP